MIFTDIPFLFYVLFWTFLLDSFPQVSWFIKYKFYGINKTITYPEPFEPFIFNWSNDKSLGKGQTSLKKLPLKALINFIGIIHSGFYTMWFKLILKRAVTRLNYVYITFCSDGFLYIKGLFIVCVIDALIADDEPLCEPVEWSLIQSWILFIFLFAWIGENLISSRYGSYTGRDKRVWFSWYKTFWLIEGWYVISMGMAALWVMVPHYYEVTYNVTYIYSWWNWYTRVFFFKFISLFTISLFIAHYLLISLRWVNWKKSFYLILLINFFLGYLLYTHFFMSFFGYFTDPRWHAKTRVIDYVQLSHEPSRWGWGDIKRDHFTHHRSKTVFWFKNDGPFASSFLFFNMMFFIALFTLSFYWITLTRRVYVTKEVTFTYTTYCVSSLRQFFYFFMLLFIFVFLSYFFIYWRTPNEFLWTINSLSWFDNFSLILLDYPSFILGILI